MKLTQAQLRSIVEDSLHEDLMRGIPDFVLQEISRKAVDELRQHLKKHILMVSSSQQATRDAFKEIEEPLSKLQRELAEVLTDKIWFLLNKAGV